MGTHSSVNRSSTWEKGFCRPPEFRQYMGSSVGAKHSGAAHESCKVTSGSKQRGRDSGKLSLGSRGFLVERLAASADCRGGLLVMSSLSPGGRGGPIVVVLFTGKIFW